ncbi:MAG: hypothetical protein Kow0080_26140 [Candidatus Promineifilaceae bacterium]
MIRLRRLLLAVLLMVLAVGVPASAQNQVHLRITQVDISAFPEVAVRLLAHDNLRNPVALTRLSLRENGVPVADFSQRSVPVGVDVVFVLDANATYVATGSNGRSLHDDVVESLTIFVNRFLNPTGIDRVSIIVPDETNPENGRFLVQDLSQGDDLLAALAAYQPAGVDPTPLQAMLTQAIDHLTALNGDGRFQAVLLLSDAGRLDQQLTPQPLVEAAQAIDLPIFAAILGVQATFEEVDNVSMLTEPTRARWIHMPGGGFTDPIYLTWQGQGNQLELRYRSWQRESGTYRLSVNVGDVAAQSSYTLTLLPPGVAVALPSDVVRREGPAFNTPLSALEPRAIDVPVAVSWADGLPREVTKAYLVVNGQQLLPPAKLDVDENGRLLLPWAVAELDEGVYELTAVVTDELGFSATSEPFLLALSLVRPEPPTPTPAATPTPPTVVDGLPMPPLPTLMQDVADWGQQNRVLTAVVGAVGLLLWLFLRWWRLRPDKAAVPAPPEEPVRMSVLPLPSQPLFAYLERVDGGTAVPLVAVEGDVLTFGRDGTVAQVVVDEPSVSRLHARIRHQENSYWLYDEGSAAGTYLNFERLGLAPRHLQDGDIVELGRVRFRFLLRPYPVVPSPEADEEE